MKTCLVVDDSRVVRKVARKILEELAFACDEAEDGQQAMDACARRMPDAILLDWNMPVTHGVAFQRRLRQMTGGDGPVVGFRAGARRVGEERVRRVGMRGCAVREKK